MKALDETEIQFINFKDFSVLLNREMKKIKNSKLGSGWIDFMRGLQEELKSRKLI
ncbi:MAG: hypothetical protein Q8K92_09350 [Leadbetterella sp.]|nr:hypothetical protein [Leadbetterella sp.]